MAPRLTLDEVGLCTHPDCQKQAACPGFDPVEGSELDAHDPTKLPRILCFYCGHIAGWHRQRSSTGGAAPPPHSQTPHESQKETPSPGVVGSTPWTQSPAPSSTTQESMMNSRTSTSIPIGSSFLSNQSRSGTPAALFREMAERRQEKIGNGIGIGTPGSFYPAAKTQQDAASEFTLRPNQQKRKRRPTSEPVSRAGSTRLDTKTRKMSMPKPANKVDFTIVLIDRTKSVHDHLYKKPGYMKVLALWKRETGRLVQRVTIPEDASEDVIIGIIDLAFKDVTEFCNARDRLRAAAIDFTRPVRPWTVLVVEGNGIRGITPKLVPIADSTPADYEMFSIATSGTYVRDLKGFPKKIVFIALKKEFDNILMPWEPEQGMQVEDEDDEEDGYSESSDKSDWCFNNAEFVGESNEGKDSAEGLASKTDEEQRNASDKTSTKFYSVAHEIKHALRHVCAPTEPQTWWPTEYKTPYKEAHMMYTIFSNSYEKWDKGKPGALEASKIWESFSVALLSCFDFLHNLYESSILDFDSQPTASTPFFAVGPFGIGFIVTALQDLNRLLNVTVPRDVSAYPSLQANLVDRITEISRLVWKFKSTVPRSLYDPPEIRSLAVCIAQNDSRLTAATERDWRRLSLSSMWLLSPSTEPAELRNALTKDFGSWEDQVQMSFHHIYGGSWGLSRVLEEVIYPFLDNYSDADKHYRELLNILLRFCAALEQQIERYLESNIHGKAKQQPPTEETSDDETKKESDKDTRGPRTRSRTAASGHKTADASNLGRDEGVPLFVVSDESDTEFPDVSEILNNTPPKSNPQDDNDSYIEISSDSDSDTKPKRKRQSRRHSQPKSKSPCPSTPSPPPGSPPKPSPPPQSSNSSEARRPRPRPRPAYGKHRRNRMVSPPAGSPSYATTYVGPQSALSMTPQQMEQAQIHRAESLRGLSWGQLVCRILSEFRHMDPSKTININDLVKLPSEAAQRHKLLRQYHPDKNGLKYGEHWGRLCNIITSAINEHT